MTEEDTFNALKRAPFLDARRIMDDIELLWNLKKITIDTRDLLYDFELAKLNWTYGEFQSETEKNYKGLKRWK